MICGPWDPPDDVSVENEFKVFKFVFVVPRRASRSPLSTFASILALPVTLQSTQQVEVLVSHAVAAVCTYCTQVRALVSSSQNLIIAMQSMQ
jgi:hypothetical protein